MSPFPTTIAIISLVALNILMFLWWVESLTTGADEADEATRNAEQAWESHKNSSKHTKGGG